MSSIFWYILKTGELKTEVFFQKLYFSKLSVNILKIWSLLHILDAICLKSTSFTWNEVFF